jgi:hypothetical protein
MTGDETLKMSLTFSLAMENDNDGTLIVIIYRSYWLKNQLSD